MSFPTCPRCGTRNGLHRETCGRCGWELSRAASVKKAAVKLAKIELQLRGGRTDA